MKQIKTYWLLAFMLAVTVFVTNSIGQLETNIITPPVIDPVKAPLPTNLIEYWAFAWPIFTALLTAGLKKIAPAIGMHIPRRIIPIIPAVLGIILGVIMQLLVKHGVTVPGTILYGLLGGAGTWLREAVDQNVVQPNTPPDDKIAELEGKIAAIRKDPKATS